MKILHILNDGQTPLSEQVIKVQTKDHEIKIVDLSKKEVPYESIVDDIFSHDRVVSW